jgi:hypothetical protein
MNLFRFTPIVAVGCLTVTASALCWKVVAEPGYIPHLEEPPCTAGTANGCASFLVCQPGTICKWSISGFNNCTNFTAIRPMMMYTGGTIVLPGGCCLGTAAGYIGLSPTATCPTPLAIGTAPGCIAIQPAPE